MSVEIALAFARLFEGNRAAYGGEEGRAIRCAGNEWVQAVLAHFDGSGPAIGVYPMVFQAARTGVHGADLNDADISQWYVRWGCVDFDIASDGHEVFDYPNEAEAHAAATNLQKVLAAFGISSWVERTRSAGRHVWVFSAVWLPARLMREALLVATDIAGVSQREVNPKSDGSNLTPDQLGNYVRLPYNEGGERKILVDGQEISAITFVGMAIEQQTDRATLERVASLYRPPVPVIEWESSKLDEYNGRVPKVVRHVIENGPNDNDRSKGLLYIAHECMKAGLSPQHALELVMIADDAWGKYTGRRDREQRLIEIVERAWS